MPELWNRQPRKAEDWDVPLPFPPPDTGPVSLRDVLPDGYEARCYACGEDYSGCLERPVFAYCGECLHAWFSEEEFVLHDATWRDGEAREAALILVCPCCSHDL